MINYTLIEYGVRDALGGEYFSVRDDDNWLLLPYGGFEYTDDPIEFKKRMVAAQDGPVYRPHSTFGGAKDRTLYLPFTMIQRTVTWGCAEVVE